jgi:regulator of protease activity HflC (stomatin/prohibitin superfamily)
MAALAAGAPLGLVLMGGMALFTALIAWFGMTVTIEPDEFGIRQVYLGPSKGVQPAVFGPGVHLVVPGYERIQVFPRDLQVLDLDDAEVAFVNGGHRLPADNLVAPSIHIQTSEGYQVTVDVTVLYRVVDPYVVVTRVGPGRLYETKIVQRSADQILRKHLGRLDAEDFYDEDMRMTATDDARKDLDSELTQWGVQVWGVLIRGYSYDQRYQAAIEQRKVQDQNVFKNQAEAIAASREAEKNRVIAEGQAKIAVEGERGNAEVRKINADADLYYRQKIAEGDLKRALAEAQGTKLENDALQQAGASNLVGQKMANVLAGTRVIVVPTTGPDAMNPLDLEKLLGGW